MIENKEVIYKKQIIMETSYLSKKGKLIPSSVLFLFEDVAFDHVAFHGVGFDQLIKKDLLWVVTQTRYEVLQEPRREDDILLQTWFLPPRHGIVQREYLITDLENGVFVKGSSSWVLMNAKSRQIDHRLNDILEGQKSCEIRNFEKRGRFIQKFESASPQVQVITSESAIDRNGHVNNVRYADYMTKIANHAMDDVTSFQIDYHKEMHCGEELNLNMKETDKSILVKGTNRENQLIFIGSFK